MYEIIRIWAKGPKSVPKLVFLPFCLVRYFSLKLHTVIASNNQQCLTCSRSKIHEKIFAISKLDFLAFSQVW